MLSALTCMVLPLEDSTAASYKEWKCGQGRCQKGRWQKSGSAKLWDSAHLRTLGVALVKDTLSSLPWKYRKKLSSTRVGLWRVVLKRPQLTYLVRPPLGSPSQKSVCCCHSYTLRKCITKRFRTGLSSHRGHSPFTVSLKAHTREWRILKCSL